MSADNIKVIIKVRPLIKRERDAKHTSQWRITNDTIECTNPLNAARFSFDQICDETKSTRDLYDKVAEPIVQSAVNGFNGTIFAYGQTSSGKTHTMLGNPSEPGIIPLAIRQIFNEIRCRKERSFLLKVTYIEIYNEKVYDLLNNRNEVKIQESSNGELYIERKEIIVTNEEAIMKQLNEGNNLRRVAETNMNVQSSRSHTIFSIMIESDEITSDEDGDAESPTVVSMLNLVDLAGSERADATGATGNRLKEGSHINKSLLSLSLVINKLSEGQEQHINYRDSKLTRILQLSLGGNAMTAIICTVTPAVVDETNFTLGFASRAKRVKNKPVINQVISDALSLKKMKKQIATLEEQLESQRKQHNEYVEKQKKLNSLKDGILQYKPTEQKVLANRRKTWAAIHTNVDPSEPSTSFKTDNNDRNGNGNGNGNSKNEKATDLNQYKFSDYGCQIEYSDERFESVVNASFAQPTTPTLTKLPKPRISMLKTPKSFKNITRRTINDDSESCSGSPISIDKNKQNKRLQEEIEEERNFLIAEACVNEEKIDSLESQLKEKIDDYNKLLEEMNAIKNENQQCNDRVDSMEKELKMANESKDIAIQNLVSSEFEYEQHMQRLQKRVNELVEQLDNSRSDAVVTELKDKIKTLSDKVTSLETELLHIDGNHKQEIDLIISEKLLIDDKCAELNSKLLKYEKIQEEYDQVSEQLVDCIQENDQHKKEIDAATKKYDKLYQEFVELDQICVTITSEKDEMIKYIDELEHEQTLLRNKCNQYDVTAPFIAKELDILRETIKTLEFRVAKEELDHLKLQKTFCEINESNNQTGFFDITDAETSRHHTSSRRSLLPKLNEEIEQVSDTTIVAGNNEYEEKFMAIIKRLMDITNADGDDYNATLDKLIYAYKEFRELLEYLLKCGDTQGLGENANSEMIIAAFNKQKEAIEQEKQSVEVELTALTEQVKQLQIKASTIDAHNNEAFTAMQVDMQLLMDEKNNAYKTIEIMQQRINEQSRQIENLTGKYNEAIDLNKTLESLMEQLQSEKKGILQAVRDLQVMDTVKNHMIRDRDIQIEDLQVEVDTKQFILDDIEKEQIKTKSNVEQLTILTEEQQQKIAKLQSKIDSLNEVNGALNKTIGELEEKIHSHLNQIDELTAENTKLNKIKAELETTNGQFTSQKSEYESKIDELEVLKTEHQREIRSLQSKVGTLSNEKDAPTEIILKLEDEINRHLKDIDVLKSDNTKLCEIKSQLEDANGQLNLNKSKLESKIDELQTELKTINELLDKLNSDKAGLESQIESLNIWNNQTNEQIVVLQKKIESLGFEKKALDETIKKDRERIRECHDEIADLKKQNFVVDEWNKELEQKRKKYELENSRLNSRMVEMSVKEADYIEEIRHLKTTIDELSDQKEDLEKKQIEAQLNCHLKQIEILKRENANMCEIKSQLENANSQLNSDKYELESKVNELNALKNQNQQQIQTLQSRIDLISNEKDALNKTIDKFKEQINGHLKDIDNLKSENSKVCELKTQLDVANDQINSQKSQFESKIDELNVLNNQNQQEIHDLKSKVDLLSNEKDMLNKTIYTLEERIANHLKNIDALKSENMKMFEFKKQFEAATDQINSQKSQLEAKVNELNAKNNQNQQEIRELQSKIDTLSNEKDSLDKTIFKLEEHIANHVKNIDNLKSDNNKLSELKTEFELINVQLNSEKSALEDELKCLQNKMKTKLLDTSTEKTQRRSMSPLRKSADFNRLLDENNHLKSLQKTLQDEVEELRQSSQQIRKKKRQSTHDDTRRISGFDSCMIDLGTQTDPADENCRCSEFCAMIDQLKADIVIKDARYFTFRRDTGVDALNDELKKLKLALNNGKSEFNMLKANYERLSDKYDTLKLKASITTIKCLKVDASAQTMNMPDTSSADGGRTFCGDIDLKRAVERAEKYKVAYMAKEAELLACKKIKEEYDKLVLECDAKATQITEYANQLDEIRKKYTALKAVCNYRYDCLKKSEAEQAKANENIKTLEMELTSLKTKYDNCKRVVLMRTARIEELQLQIKSINENIPNNFNE